MSKNIEKIENNAFLFCSNLKDVYYAGTESQWNEISIGVCNECLTSATIHYNSPDGSGNLIPSAITAEVNGNNLNVSVSARVNSVGSSYTMLVVAYQEDGKMLGFQMVPISFGMSGQETEFTVELKECSSAARVKAIFTDTTFAPKEIPLELTLD